MCLERRCHRSYIFGMVLGFGMCGLRACVFQRFHSIACFKFFYMAKCRTIRFSLWLLRSFRY